MISLWHQALLHLSEVMEGFILGRLNWNDDYMGGSGSDPFEALLAIGFMCLCLYVYILKYNEWKRRRENGEEAYKLDGFGDFFAITLVYSIVAFVAALPITYVGKLIGLLQKDDLLFVFLVMLGILLYFDFE